MKKIVVTRVINKYEILINVGKDDGINDNSTFEILGKLDDVSDPITKEPLGTFTYSKVTLKVKRLLPKMCICEDYNNKREYFSNTLTKGMFSDIKNPLNINVDEYAEQQLDKEIYIGDEVKLLDKIESNV